ncbi:hypothetical protein HYE66_07715 [Aggregatibacter actinomycetemcomitans]|nr:hypothetical protein [Aggregatibacter actinomycetemcomitans]
MIYSKLNYVILLFFSLTALAGGGQGAVVTKETLADRNIKEEPVVSFQKSSKDNCYINYPKEQRHLAEALPTA